MLAVFAVGSLAAALTRTPAELIAARAVMGTGAAFIMPATLSVLSGVFTVPAERAKAIGIWSAVSGLGVAIGPVAGGVLLAHFGWDSIFLVNLPLVALALAAGHWLVPASRAPQARRLDPAGALLSVVAFTLLTWALIAAPASGWLSAATLARMGGAAAALTAFATVEIRGDHPMLPVSLFRNPRLAGAAISLFAPHRAAPSRRPAPPHRPSPRRCRQAARDANPGTPHRGSPRKPSDPRNSPRLRGSLRDHEDRLRRCCWHTCRMTRRPARLRGLHAAPVTVPGAKTWVPVDNPAA